ncbi:response regulator [Leptospira levettii]|nr:response regulator [Leptospira levettii]
MALNLICTSQLGKQWFKLLIALTASAELETREQIKAVGMNYFVSKPFNPNDLLNLLHYWLGT